MQDQLITFETAKLAKEKGFNLQQEFFYNRGSGWKLQCDQIIRTGVDEFIEAPTQSLLQKWLREKHNLFIQIDMGKDEHSVWYDSYVYPCEIIKSEEDYDCLANSESGLDTYEQALEAGLQEALKLIK